MNQNEDQIQWHDEFREYGYTYDRMVDSKPTCTVHSIEKNKKTYVARAFSKKKFFVSPILKAQVSREIEVGEKIRKNFNYLVSYIDFFYTESFLVLVYEDNGFSSLRMLLLFSELKIEEVIILLRDLFNAMEELKFLGIIHRYLCPDTIVIDDKCNLKIQGYEFGEPHAHKKMPPPEHLHFCRNIRDGAYVSPEALFNRVCTFKAPLYSLGAILYSMLHNGEPHVHGDVEHIKIRVKNNDVFVNVNEKYDREENTKEFKAVLHGLLKVDHRDRISFVDVRDFVQRMYNLVKENEEMIRGQLAMKIRSNKERTQANKSDNRKAGSSNIDLKKYVSVFGTPLPAPGAIRKAYRIKDVGEKFVAQTIQLANSLRRTENREENQMKKSMNESMKDTKPRSIMIRSRSKQERLGVTRPLMVGRLGYSMTSTRTNWANITGTTQFRPNNN